MYTPRVLVIGVGDLGSYIGASLVKKNHTEVDVLLASRKSSLLSTIDYANTLLVNSDGLQNNGEATFDEHGLNDAKELIKESDSVLLVGALGGSSSAPLIAGINTQMVMDVLIHFSVPEGFSLGLMHEFLDALYHACPKLQLVLSCVTVTKKDVISVLLIASSAPPASY